jgi:hypothetical protein
MDRRKFSISMMAAAVAGLTGCGGGGGLSNVGPVVSGPVVPPVVPPIASLELATATALPASTVFLQTIAATDGDRSAAPGQANAFDLDRDFSISDGNNDQFDGALMLGIDAGAGAVTFLSDQVYAELTALGPDLGAADGVKTVSFTGNAPWLSSGAISAVLHPVPDARLQQTLDLTSAAGNPVDLTWGGNPSAGANNFSDEPYYLQVVLRDTTGSLLATLFRQDATGTAGTWGIASLSAYAGQVVVLSFEQRSSYATSVIDDVSVVDTVTTMQFVTNGDFEAGGTGWTVPELRVSQNVRTGPRSLAGFDVERTFFTQPNALWARMTDVLSNTSGAAIQATVTYETNLGSDGAGIIYATPGAPTKALTTWDGDGGDRDIGLVFGTGGTATFLSASTIGVSDGDEIINVAFAVDVPAGGSVTLVNFIVLNGTDTSGSAADTTARAIEVDAIAADIANNFRTNVAYQRGLTQAQLDTLVNF